MLQCVKSYITKRVRYGSTSVMPDGRVKVKLPEQVLQALSCVQVGRNEPKNLLRPHTNCSGSVEILYVARLTHVILGDV